LKEILAEKIDDGFAFPLNPKWVLCDEGWTDLYDKLLASEAPNVQDAMNVWYPADVRERIATISSKHPTGFYSREAAESVESQSLSTNERYLSNQHIYVAAELELERYKHRKKGMAKFRGALLKIKPKKRTKVNFSSTALLMIQVGKAVDAQAQVRGEDEDVDEDSRSKDVLDKVKCYLGESNDVQRSSIATVETTKSSASISSEMPASHHEPVSNRVAPRTTSFTRLLLKRLSSKKKTERQNTM